MIKAEWSRFEASNYENIYLLFSMEAKMAENLHLSDYNIDWFLKINCVRSITLQLTVGLKRKCTIEKWQFSLKAYRA